MLRLVAVLVVAALLWMCWWVIGHSAYQRTLASWMEQRRNDGWVADFSDIATRGFPNRFDTTMSDLTLADPGSGIAWSAPFVQFLSLAYRPHEVIAVLPDKHVISTPREALQVNHGSARASIHFKPSTDLALERARLVLKDPRIHSSLGWTVSSTELRFAIETIPVRESAYRVGMELLELSLPDMLRRALSSSRTLPDKIGVVRADAELGLDAQIDRRFLEGAHLGINRLDLADLSVRWGEFSFSAKGNLTVSEDGVPDGEIMLRAAGWKAPLDLAETMGLIEPAFLEALETALDLMSGHGDVVELPLVFSRGQVSLGLFPLGRAPRLQAW
ncbi:MAG: DUF2125 domain-containing protein [Boseongicola sp. SB0665_bin_10]|nr:DUF2125 domain-containing protein [Boseongicola sp. SB0665_bin_10]